MNKQQKNITRATAAAFLAANDVNCIAMHRNNGVVIAIRGGDGQNGENNVHVSTALVGTGDRFKKWHGIALAVSRVENGESMVIRTDENSVYGIVENLMEMNQPAGGSDHYSNWEWVQNIE